VQARTRMALLAGVAIVAAVVALPSSATFGGTNGRITFARDHGTGLDIFSAKADGSDVTRLTVSGTNHSSIFTDWSPGGQLIAFDSDRTDDGVQLWVMDWDGQNQRQLTVDAGFHGDPAWNPAGTRLAFEADWGQYPQLEGIWTAAFPASGVITQAGATRVTATPPGMLFDSEPQYSPNGQWIVFSRYKSCKNHPTGHLEGFPYGCLSAIFIVHPEGTGLKQLTPWGMNASAPDWSPNGTKIVFDSGDSGTIGAKGNVWVMNADGSKRTRIVKSPPASDAGQGLSNFRFDFANNPVWSPAGDKIMFTQWLNDGFPVQLVTVNPDGSGKTVVVDGDLYQNKADWGTHS
jgi:Tol biopolymer transport system component